MERGEKYVRKEEDSLSDIKKDPYNYICNWMEELLPYTGRKAFEIICLMPPSLILPDLLYKSKKIRSNINVLLLTSSGGGKSTICKQLSYLTYHPIDVRSITSAKLESKIYSSPLFTFIVEDFATMSRDPFIVKTVESILGEEKRLQRSTMNKDVDMDTDGVGLLAGIPQDLSNYLTSGLIFRLFTLSIIHTQKEHSEIGKHIMESIGNNGNFDEKEELIKKYYQELAKIQAGEHSEIGQITGYYLDEKFKKKSYEVWDKYTKQIYQKIKAQLNWFRLYQEFYRMLVSHAFLNVFNRKVENGILYPNEEDYKVAINLMKKDLQTKFKLINMESFSRSISNIKEFERIMNSDKVEERDKNMLKQLVKIKRGKIVNN